MTAAGMSEVRKRLSNARLPSGERNGEIVARPHDCDRNPNRGQAQELRLGAGTRLDVHKRRASPRERALDEAVDEGNVESRRDDDKLERASRDTSIGLQERKRGCARVRLGSREHLERTPPFSLRCNRLGFASSRIDNEAATPSSLQVGLQNRTCCAYGDLEALAGTDLRVAVEQDGDLVARRILELSHHQPPAPRRRAPVHLPERFALGVLANAVQLVAGRSPEQQTASVLCMRAALREQAGRAATSLGYTTSACGSPCTSDERASAEWILDREADGLEGVAPSRNGA